jgi:hypothetical protein
MLIHGGYGVKNPEYDALNNDLDLFSAVEVTDDPENKYKCKICSKTFKLQRLMNRHMKNHSNIKRYLCTFCQKGFNDAFDLKRHTRTHTGVRPFQCFECDRKFTQRCSLESHLNKVHQVELSFKYKERRAKLYVCEDCGNTTENPEEHLDHLQKFHPNSPALKRSYDRRIIKISNGNNKDSSSNKSMNSSMSNASMSPLHSSQLNTNAQQLIHLTQSRDQEEQEEEGYLHEGGDEDQPEEETFNNANEDTSSFNYEQENLQDQDMDENEDNMNNNESQLEEEIQTINNNNNNDNITNNDSLEEETTGRKKSRKSPKNLVKIQPEEDEELVQTYDEYDEEVFVGQSDEHEENLS